MNYFLLLIFFLVGQSAFSQHEHNHSENTPSAVVKRNEEPRVPIHVPEEQQQKIGLKTQKVEKKHLIHMIRTVGTITSDQRLEAHIHTRISGWIESIYADFVGKPVKKGDPLYDLYSPEIVSTQEEYIAARNQAGVGRELAKAALDRLKLWEVPADQILKLQKTGKSSRTVTFKSPANGVVTSKNAIQGMYITPGMELYQIADLSKVWILITLYEFDVSVVKVGDEVEVQLPYQSNKTFKVKISFISPEIEVQSRTARARIEIDNKDQSLKPNMFANVTMKKDLGESIVIPEDALIDTGLKKIVFVKGESSIFEPRALQVGPRVDGQFAVLSGLKEGEEIVTSSHFLIDAESKLKAALEKGGAVPKHKHGGN